MQVGIDENLVKDIIYIIYVWGCSALEEPLAVYLSNPTMQRWQCPIHNGTLKPLSDK